MASNCKLRCFVNDRISLNLTEDSSSFQSVFNKAKVNVLSWLIASELLALLNSNSVFKQRMKSHSVHIPVQISICLCSLFYLYLVERSFFHLICLGELTSSLGELLLVNKAKVLKFLYVLSKISLRFQLDMFKSLSVKK